MKEIQEKRFATDPFQFNLISSVLESRPRRRNRFWEDSFRPLGRSVFLTIWLKWQPLFSLKESQKVSGTQNFFYHHHHMKGKGFWRVEFLWRECSESGFEWSWILIEEIGDNSGGIRIRQEGIWLDGWGKLQFLEEPVGSVKSHTPGRRSNWRGLLRCEEMAEIFSNRYAIPASASSTLKFQSHLPQRLESYTYIYKN